MSPIPNLKLNSGSLMPAIGLGISAGTLQEARDKAHVWIESALKSGYRHLDTAWLYQTERAVGEAIRASGIPRSEIFVTTKLAWHHHACVEKAIQDSLTKSGLDYFDLYLMHFPQAAAYKDNSFETPLDPRGFETILENPTFNEVWADMEKVLASGRVKAIGVSNFSIKTIQQLLKTANVVPAVNQVELHPYLIQEELVEYAKEKGIVITAYSPTGKAKILADPVILEIAAHHDATTAQVILAWHVARGVAAVPKSTNAERQMENLQLAELRPEDIQRINDLDRNERISNKAGLDGKMLGWTYEQLGW
ncbi:Aldo/keto reductase [Athelia psychrophila]|uniref:Aldo/keto reductase n=1 Tax=Athelia psychrophila TaxID=1759441 RepID=A0A166B6C6_9AGAM|nr:Aldo/keto reductase [Fibularhizoctonia sp. CBS 109695]